MQTQIELLELYCKMKSKEVPYTKSISVDLSNKNPNFSTKAKTSPPIRRHSRIKISLLEKNEKQVSHVWKNAQIITYVVVIVSGIACCKSMGDVVFMFSNKCILNGILNIKKDPNGTAWIQFDNFELVRWGDMKDCDFCVFYPVASLAVAGSLATFFTMCGRGGDTTRNLPQPWRMVPIAFFFNIIFVIISCVHVAYVYDGFAGFCRNIRPVDAASRVNNCQEVYQASIANVKGDLGTNITAAQFFSALGLVGWITSLVVIVVRCATHADFLVIAERDKVSPPKCDKKFDDDSSSVSSSCEYSTPLTSINY